MGRERKQRRRIQKLVNHLNKSILRATQLMTSDDTYPWGKFAEELVDLKRRVLLAAWERDVTVDEEGMPK